MTVLYKIFLGLFFLAGIAHAQAPFCEIRGVTKSFETCVLGLERTFGKQCVAAFKLCRGLIQFPLNLLLYRACLKVSNECVERGFHRAKRDCFDDCLGQAGDDQASQEECKKDFENAKISCTASSNTGNGRGTRPCPPPTTSSIQAGRAQNGNGLVTAPSKGATNDSGSTKNLQRGVAGLCEIPCCSTGMGVCPEIVISGNEGVAEVCKRQSMEDKSCLGQPFGLPLCNVGC